MEYLPNILGLVDSDITKRLIPSLKKKGITITTSTKITEIEKTTEGFVIFGEGKKGEVFYESERILISTGRSALVDNLNLEEIGIGTTKKGIKVDLYYETSIKGIYAISDVKMVYPCLHMLLYIKVSMLHII